MAINMYFKYAIIELDTNMCIGVETTSHEVVGNPEYISIPVYDEEYIFKFYINGAWYEDAEATIPWQSSLL